MCATCKYMDTATKNDNVTAGQVGQDLPTISRHMHLTQKQKLK